MAKVTKTDAEWRQQLTPEQYAVARQKATERPFSGLYTSSNADGAYHCVCCDSPLFTAETKFDSGCGWPSFFAPVSPDAVRMETDLSHGMHRIEVLCATCDAHLGHVFPDGPGPTHQRYCINSVSLAHEKDRK